MSEQHGSIELDVIREIRALLQENRQDPGIELFRDLGKTGIAAVERLVKESERRSGRHEGNRSARDDEELLSTKLHNVAELVRLGEKLYPSMAPSDAAMLLRAELEKGP